MVKIFAEVDYHKGLMAGTKCRWTVVYGFTDLNDENNYNCDCWPLSTKPTKRQLRRFKKIGRMMYTHPIKVTITHD